MFERDGTSWAGLGAGLLFASEFVLMYLIYLGLARTSAWPSVGLLYWVVAFRAHYLNSDPGRPPDDRQGRGSHGALGGLPWPWVKGLQCQDGRRLWGMSCRFSRRR